MHTWVHGSSVMGSQLWAYSIPQHYHGGSVEAVQRRKSRVANVRGIYHIIPALGDRDVS